MVTDMRIFRWDTYPLPINSPLPYSGSNSSWGIVPAWGYAVVVESTTSIPQGAIMWGFWPTSSALTDLKLEAAEPKGHWIETSGHRQRLMHLYNRYNEVQRPPVAVSSPFSSFTQEELEVMAWTTLFGAVGESSYLLSHHVFSPS